MAFRFTEILCGKIGKMNERRSGNNVGRVCKLLLAFLFLANCALIPAHDHHGILDQDSCFSSIQTEDNHQADCHHACKGLMLECCRFLGDQHTSLIRKMSGPSLDSSITILTQGTDRFTPDRVPGSVTTTTDRPVPCISPLAYRLRAPPFLHHTA